MITMDSATSFTIITVAALAVIAVSVWSAGRPRITDKHLDDLTRLLRELTELNARLERRSDREDA